MKIKCDFCKTEYNVSDNTCGRVRCACCGHTWRTKRNNKKLWLWIAAILVALAIVSLITYHLSLSPQATKSGPLEMEIMSQGIDSDGYWRASGVITNNSDDAYGVPNLRVKIGDTETIVLSPLPILGAGESDEFEISGQTIGTGYIEIEFME